MAGRPSFWKPQVTCDLGLAGALRGEKRTTNEDKDKHFSERFYGRFERRIAVGSDIDEDKVDAKFRKGVLTITLPKTAKAQASAKRIAISKDK